MKQRACLQAPHRRGILCLAAVLALGLTTCSRGPTDPEPGGRVPPRPLTAAEEQLVTCDNAFAFELFREIAAREAADTSLVVSPLSVAMALTMTANGARGETEAAMHAALELHGLTVEEINTSYRGLLDLLAALDPDVVLEIANSIWPRLDYPVEEAFLELNQQTFDAEARELDFDDPAAVDTINGWISEKTHGLIPRMLAMIPPDVVMYLINAIYFKGAWTYPFDEEETISVPFHRADGSQTTCRMMSLGRIEFEKFYDPEQGVQGLDLPYGVGDFRMTLLLPDRDRDLATVLAGLTAEQWDAWLARLAPGEVNVNLPKFKFGYQVLLNDALAALGMGIAFGPAADFTGISVRDPWISRVLHKAVIEVNEEGTEAAAVTIVEMIESATPGFYADRPFFFAIRDRHSGAILFMGRVMDPVWTE
jgi:serpin B